MTYILIIAGLAILYISTSKKVMEKISRQRNESEEWWGIHRGVKKGDLVSLAYLDYVKKFHGDEDYSFHPPAYEGKDDINLYINGDSYTFKIPDSAFAGVNRYEYAWVYNKHIRYNLDTTKTNILILEHAERYVNIFYGGYDLLLIVYDSARGSVHDSFVQKVATVDIPPDVDDHLEHLFHEAFRDWFNPLINQNLEYNLFNYRFMSAPRLLKAAINYSLFNRASGDVVIAENGNHLYLKETVMPNSAGSSYYVIPDKEYGKRVEILNTLYQHYKAEGFDEVYLAPIPNPVTILEPEGYNNLIPRLQNDPALEMKYIDIYTAFKNTDKQIYRPGDSHWNNNGMQLWIQAVNDTLSKWHKH